MTLGPDPRPTTRFTSLVALHDLTSDSDRVLPVVGQLARRGRLDVHLLTTGTRGLEDLDRSELNALASHLHGCAVTPIVLTSDEPAAAIAEFTARCPTALICLASHGRTALGEALFGSMTDELLTRRAGPVFAVGPHFEGDSVKDELIVCIDEHSGRTSLLRWAAMWKATFDARVTLLEVVPPTAGPTATATPALRDAAAALDGAAMSVLASHDPVAAILDRVATSHGVVALASRNQHGLRRALLGSVAREVVRWSTAPVLLTVG